jgi:tetratricopeptide (TPR) repeat protein
MDYTSVLNSPGLPNKARAVLLVNRGFLLGLQGRWHMAIADWDCALSAPESPLDQRLKALLNRADIYHLAGRRAEAVADATTLAAMPDSAGSTERASAHLLLALCHLEKERMPDAIASVQRHLEDRIKPAPAGTTETLSSCWELARSDQEQATSLLRKLVAELVA